jgi:hypothetical protein
MKVLETHVGMNSRNIRVCTHRKKDLGRKRPENEIDDGRAPERVNEVNPTAVDAGAEVRSLQHTRAGLLTFDAGASDIHYEENLSAEGVSTYSSGGSSHIQRASAAFYRSQSDRSRCKFEPLCCRIVCGMTLDKIWCMRPRNSLTLLTR